MSIVSISQVISTAFNRSVDTKQIKQADVDIAEFDFLRPILTENFYEEVLSAPASYSSLITNYIIPAVAYYVKYVVFNDFFIEVSDRGVNHLTSDNATPVSNQARTDAKADAMYKANVLGEKLRDYLEKRKLAQDALYLKYRDFTNVVSEPKMIGGILIDDNTNYISKENEAF